jgi:hypothetical protein
LFLAYLLFIRDAHNDFITCTSLLEAVGIGVPCRNIGDFNIFYTSFSRNKYPSVSSALAANEIRNKTQETSIEQAASRATSACCLLHAGFFLGLLFDPQDKDDVLSRSLFGS